MIVRVPKNTWVTGLTKLVLLMVKVLQTVSSSTNATTDTRKKLVKKLDEKSSTKEGDKPLMHSKVKKEAEIKKMRQSLNFKATFFQIYKGQQPSMILLIRTVLTTVQFVEPSAICKEVCIIHHYLEHKSSSRVVAIS